ncbi:hypothetical protein ABZW18_31520 [Streptomyces sp. NPDC004647]|uniref:hypothetical protein n=1 Tax=Streptomyces sp. NPDC004647 TaxID=3154671 RepID=UPI00339E7181
MPVLIFEPVDPQNPSRFMVCLKSPDGSQGELLGMVWQSAGAGWTAEFFPENTGIGVPGFLSKQLAAEFLYWYAAPVQSARSRPSGCAHPGAATSEAGIDMSVCTCCLDNGCACEGTRRSSAHSGVDLSAASHPSLIPAPGVLFSLLKFADGYLVEMNTRGAGAGVGFLQQLEDGTFSVRLGHKEVGRADHPETGLWAVVHLHSGSKRYGRLVKGFEPIGDNPPVTSGIEP